MIPELNLGILYAAVAVLALFVVCGGVALAVAVAWWRSHGSGSIEWTPTRLELSIHEDRSRNAPDVVHAPADD